MSKRDELAMEQDRIHHKEVEDALTFMLLCERGFGVPSFDFFDGATLGWKSVMQDLVAEVFGTPTPHSAEYDDIAAKVKPLRGGLLLASQDQNDKWDLVGAHEMDYYSKKRLAMFKKQAIFDENTNNLISIPIDTTKRIIELRGVGISEVGTTHSLFQNYYMCDPKSGRWFPAEAERVNVSRFDGKPFASSYESLMFATCVMWSAFCLKRWRVYIRFGEQKPGLALPTDPTGVKEFFRFREIPEGKSRRDALLHWVSEHWRQNRYDPEIENYVREHLRGAQKFAWHNLNAEILIPQVDQDKQASLIVNRKRLKKAELDRRIKEARR